MTEFLLIVILATGQPIEASVSIEYCTEWMEEVRTGRQPHLEVDGVDVPVTHSTCGPRDLVHQPPPARVGALKE